MRQLLRSILWWWLQPFMWKPWVDITTFTFGYQGYLLQGRVNKISNAKKFRITKMRQLFSVAEVSAVSLKELNEKGLCLNLDQINEPQSTKD